MPFAVRFVRRRCTQQKKHKGLRQGGCANLRRKMACRLCFALPRCASVKKTEGRSAARRYALRPLALAKWRQHSPRGFCAELLGGDTFFVIMPDASPLLSRRHLLFVLYSLQKYARVWCGRRGSFCLRFGLRLTIMRPLWYGEGRHRRSERNCDDTRRMRLLLCLPPTCGYGYTCASSRCAAATL